MRDTDLKVVIPMAGLGTRLRPLTWSKPKQLISMAGKTVLDHVLESLSSLPEPQGFELINIIGYLGDQIKDHIHAKYPNIRSHFIVQEDPRGQSHALKLAEKYLQGPMLVVFADTLIKSDLGFLKDEPAEMVAWVCPVPDPRRFGVAELNQSGLVQRLVEKPNDVSNNLALVGFYYFKRGEDLLSAIDEQMKRNLQLKGEYFLVDAVNIMLERGLRMRTKEVDAWLDAGTPEALLETCQYLLRNGKENSTEAAKRLGVVVIPPVYIHPTAEVSESIIGPDVSLGAGCQIERCIIRSSILEEEVNALGVVLEDSLIGRQAVLRRSAGVVNVSDNTRVTF